MNEPSARRRVIDDYFRTTSASGGAASQAGFDASAKGLRLRLEPWFRVAGRSVLDLGSGTGELCKLALDAGAREVTGVNLSVDEIEYARSRCSARFVHQDIERYLVDLKPDSIDNMFALNILEHLDKDQLLRVLEAAFRALSPGGTIVAMVPNATSPFGGMTRYWDITHESAFTPSSVTQLAKLIGFEAAPEFRECGPVPHGFISGIRFVLWQVIRLAIKAYLMVELASTKGNVYTADMLFRMTKPGAGRMFSSDDASTSA